MINIFQLDFVQVVFNRAYGYAVILWNYDCVSAILVDYPLDSDSKNTVISQSHSNLTITRVLICVMPAHITIKAYAEAFVSFSVPSSGIPLP
jgi:hypothetical protein